MKDEYDFSNGVRGKYIEKYSEGVKMSNYNKDIKNISRFAKKLAETNNRIPRMGDIDWVKPITNWINEDANITEASDVKQWKNEISNYSPESHAVLGQKMREEQAYKIWVSENKPDGEKEETCSICGKSYKIKDRHYWEAFVYIFFKNTCDWQMSVRLDKVVCDWFHHAI